MQIDLKKKILLLKNLKILFHEHMCQKLLLEKKFLKRFMNTNCKWQIRRVEKVIKRGDKKYVKWKGYFNSFNSWIDKKGKMDNLMYKMD